ncbi:MAG: hypothetical protein KatS3mg102_1889 [Planctomycetota bacterium]|nr:MAG: hypothetical protein KatS3mg102_1889 [Planctomycetota bacterium]
MRAVEGRNKLAALLVVLAGTAWPAARALGSDALGLRPPELSPRAEQAIRRGLDYLAAQQHPEGYWIEMIGRKVNDEYRGHMGRHVGVTALACMSFLANGSLPDRGRYGENIRRGVEWLLAQVQPDNGFITADGSRMYSHGFATLLLAEVYGTTGDPRVRARLQQAVDAIVQSQNRHGGWRYLPGAEDADMSITVTCVMALRGARNVGIYVPRATIDAAIQYIKRSFVGEHPDWRQRGGFWYQVREDRFQLSRTSFALTAAGVVALYGAGEYDAPEIRQGLRFLARPATHYPYGRPPAWRMHQSFDYFYAHYYAVQAFFQAGGELWAWWFPMIRDELLEGQHQEGYWEDLVGRNYATAMATVILQIPYRYLPIFER